MSQPSTPSPQESSEKTPDTPPPPSPTEAEATTEAPQPGARPDPSEGTAPSPADQPTPDSVPDGADAPAEAPRPAKRRTTVTSVMLDTLLVLLLLGALGYSGYFLHRELPKFRIPSPIEVALEENEELSKRYDELISRSHHAEVQLAMREKLAALDAKLASLEDQYKQGENRIAELKTQALGVQHEIRQADKEARAVALSLLPGLPLGDVATTTGKRFNNATVYRIENNARGRRVVLRSPEGQVSYPLKELVRDNLPQIFLYAFGYTDLVDMSDFTKADGSPATEQAKADTTPQPAKNPGSAKPRKSRGVIIINGERYEIGGGSPVVDTEAAAKNPPAPSQETMPATDDIWQAPDGALPF